MSCVNKHCEACDREARAEIEALGEAVANANKRHGATIHERDRLKDRVESLERSHKLLENASRFLPVVGVTCDGVGCTSVLGLVGVKLASTDVLADAMEPVALVLGWLKRDGKHLCPACKEK